MAINYTYPVKTVPTSADDILIIDNADSSKATKRIAISTLPGGSGTVTSVTATTPLVSTGGATPSISLTAVPIALGGTGVTTGLTGYLPLAGGAMTGPITTNSTFDGVDVAARDAVLTTTTNTANAALPLAGGTMTGAITSGSSITALQLIPAAVTLVISLGASGNQDLVLYDTAFGTFSSFNISASGIPIVEFYINSLTEGATAELFLTTTPTAYVQPSAWQTIPSGGVATPILWPGGTPPNTSSGGVYKFTFTMAGGVVYGVADLAFA
jgi:hypothetical protein